MVVKWSEVVSHHKNHKNQRSILTYRNIDNGGEVE
jgi:hypothetical protein